MFFSSRHNCTGIAICFLLSLLVPTGVVYARGLGAEAEWSYVDYRSKGFDGDTSASSFVQRYTLLYNTRGRFAGGTGGYAGDIGYEWGGINATVKMPGESTDFTVGTGHVLFRGDLYYQSRQLPLRLKLFSSDMNRMGFYDVGDIKLSEPVIPTDLPTSIQNGQHISSGASLTLGGRSYAPNSGLAFFNELPALYVDYRDDINRNLQGRTPMNTETRQLGVSVNNYNSNWLQYNITKYKDFNDSRNDATDQQVIIGTVNRTQERLWVDLTNWIKVSADGQFLSTTGGPDSRDRKELDANIFAIMSQPRWEARTFNTLARTEEAGSIKYDVRLPLIVTGVWGPATDWHVALVHGEIRTLQSGFTTDSESDTLVAAKLTTFKRSLFTLTPLLSVESISRLQTDRQIIVARVESASTRRFSDRVSLLGAYEYRRTSEDGAKSTTFSQHRWTGTFAYRALNNLRVEISEVGALASGTLGQESSLGFSNTYTGTGNSANSTNGSFSSDLRSSGFSSLTDLRVHWDVTPRLIVESTLSEAYTDSRENGTETDTNFRNAVTYTSPNLNANAEVGYSTGSRFGVTTELISIIGKADYFFSRTLVGGIRYSRHTSKSEGSLSMETEELGQNFHWVYQPNRGLERTLFEVNQTLTYTRTVGTPEHSDLTMWLIGRYYPLRRLYMSAGAGYSLIEPYHERVFSGNGEIGVQYSKLQGSLTYSYGKRDNHDARTDKRFSANLRKQF